MKNHITCIEDDDLNIDLRVAVKHRINFLINLLEQEDKYHEFDDHTSENVAYKQEISRLEAFIREI